MDDFFVRDLKLRHCVSLEDSACCATLRVLEDLELLINGAALARPWFRLNSLSAWICRENG